MNTPEHAAWLERVRAEYEKDPAIGPFRRKPVSFELAAEYGLSSYARAVRRANDADREGK